MGPPVVVLHGGPGAPEYMAAVARGLADSFRVLEPFQRASGAAPLRVADHVEDLRDLVEARCEGVRPALVGSSWGAMLALAFAAAHPGRTGPLALIGCGAFDPAARARLRASVEERLGAGLRRRLAHLPEEFSDPDQRLRAESDLILPLYSCDLITTDLELEACDARAHEETWDDISTGPQCEIRSAVSRWGAALGASSPRHRQQRWPEHAPSDSARRLPAGGRAPCCQPTSGAI